MTEARHRLQFTMRARWGVLTYCETLRAGLARPLSPRPRAQVAPARRFPFSPKPKAPR